MNNEESHGLYGYQSSYAILPTDVNQSRLCEPSELINNSGLSKFVLSYTEHRQHW